MVYSSLCIWVFLSTLVFHHHIYTDLEIENYFYNFIDVA